MRLILVIIADIVKIFKSEMKILVERQNPIHLPKSNFVNEVLVLCSHVIENMEYHIKQDNLNKLRQTQSLVVKKM